MLLNGRSMHELRTNNIGTEAKRSWGEGEIFGRGRDFRGGGGERGRRANQNDEGHPFVAFESHSVEPVPRQTFVNPVTTVDATVKWFNPEQGFGFVAMADGLWRCLLAARSCSGPGKGLGSGRCKAKSLCRSRRKGSVHHQDCRSRRQRDCKNVDSASRLKLPPP